MKSFLFSVLSFIIPFIVVIRCSTYLYKSQQFGVYPSLIVSSLLGSIVLVFVVHRAFKSLTLKFKHILIASSILMLSFVGYTTYVFSDSNAKSNEVKSEFYSLHPILRLSIGGLVILDGNLVVTDMKRNVNFYDNMGLKRNNRSLHFMQSTGYVHAVDIRTKNRFFLMNWLTQAYFWLMGFDTLRHGGTADHLHISIPVK